jgi:hypothetical protein
MENTPFDEQLRYARELMSLPAVGAQHAAPLLIRRACIDATGIGAHMAETLARTEAGHADEFWAKALADLAADPEAHQRAARSSDAFLAEAEPLVVPAAFGQVDSNWSAFAW